jgi:hypothetical protein
MAVTLFMTTYQEEMEFCCVEGKIEQAFNKFHAENPHVFENLKSMALMLNNKGHKRYGIKALFEVLRYNKAITTSGNDFKLNNNFTALYARKIMEECSKLDGFFETRERKD